MPFISTRLTRRFDAVDPKKVTNGAPASGALFSVIADGQQYLFGNDMPMTNFFSGRGGGAVNSIVATGTTIKTVYTRVFMPPYATHCEFWFACGVDASDDDDTSIGYPYVSVASSGSGGETRGLYAIPIVNDSDAVGTVFDLGGTTDLAMYLSSWCGLFGTADEGAAMNGIQSVKLQDSVQTYEEVEVAVTFRASSTANGKLTMNAAYYRVVAPAIYEYTP